MLPYPGIVVVPSGATTGSLFEVSSAGSYMKLPSSPIFTPLVFKSFDSLRFWQCVEAGLPADPKLLLFKTHLVPRRIAENAVEASAVTLKHFGKSDQQVQTSE